MSLAIKDEDDSEVTTPLNELWKELHTVDAMMREFYRCYLRDEKPSEDFLLQVDDYIRNTAYEG